MDAGFPKTLAEHLGRWNAFVKAQDEAYEREWRLLELHSLLVELKKTRMT